MVWATVGILRTVQKKTPKSAGYGIYLARPLDISRCDVHDMAMVGPTIARSATVGQLDAELLQNPPDLVNQFSHRWMCNSMDCGFKMADF
jgi:hypothetical protein